MSLADLRLEHVDACLRGADFGAGGLHVFLTGGATGGEFLLALVFLLREVVLGALLLQLCLEVFDGKPPGIQFGLLRGGVDLYQ